MRNNNCDAFIL